MHAGIKYTHSQRKLLLGGLKVKKKSKIWEPKNQLFCD